ncbi:ABC transporter permease [Agrobacterium vitis]|uniref:ABC transporter permease n=1 Tax=Agrobacterium vitis TaxID=373 RepID=UPI00087302BC|nr:ABC transporter permease [Agrobacterium vitis]MCE6076826.1 ABC transporter permease subunit [Agrobacterium vitis]MCM2450093.1 ABC transporter permease [Agrobacterium vitis]MCM2470840.1 ABC transporter permease [Agrobacterium vitis]MUO71210.1 ABC transporter permease subunit [Agrobacterium vitis]MUO84326.1 ABC transporter permease subunit [Agrobacterium vitis]
MRIRFNLLAGGLVISGVCLAAVIAPFWTPYDPLALGFTTRLKPPSAAFWLGSDEFGRDLLSRLMAGAGPSIGISLLAVTTALVLGTVLGLVSGYWKGWPDRLLMVINDALMAFPGILLALGLLAILGANVRGIVLALGLAFTPAVTRIVRGTVISVREREYVDASRVMGNSELYTLIRHILPNCLAPIIVLATSMMGWAILAESALSFLGLGLAPPAPTWGNMLSASRAFLSQAPWLGIFPGVAISLTLLAINLLGDGLRDLLDPRMKGL